MKKSVDPGGQGLTVFSYKEFENSEILVSQNVCTWLMAETESAAPDPFYFPWPPI